ncbi:MAG: acyl-CoA dehydrogenase family protein [Steroidobacteraceae bacterium]
MSEEQVYTQEHLQFKETMQRFFAREVEPNIKAWEREGIFPADLFRKAGAAGILQAGAPAAYAADLLMCVQPSTLSTSAVCRFTRIARS